MRVLRRRGCAKRGRLPYHTLKPVTVPGRVKGDDLALFDEIAPEVPQTMLGTPLYQGWQSDHLEGARIERPAKAANDFLPSHPGLQGDDVTSFAVKEHYLAWHMCHALKLIP